MKSTLLILSCIAFSLVTLTSALSQNTTQSNSPNKLELLLALAKLDQDSAKQERSTNLDDLLTQAKAQQNKQAVNLDMLLSQAKKEQAAKFNNKSNNLERLLRQAQNDQKKNSSQCCKNQSKTGAKKLRCANNCYQKQCQTCASKNNCCKYQRGTNGKQVRCANKCYQKQRQTRASKSNCCKYQRGTNGKQVRCANKCYQKQCQTRASKSNYCKYQRSTNGKQVRCANKCYLISNKNNTLDLAKYGLKSSKKSIAIREKIIAHNWDVKRFLVDWDNRFTTENADSVALKKSCKFPASGRGTIGSTFETRKNYADPFKFSGQKFDTWMIGETKSGEIQLILISSFNKNVRPVFRFNLISETTDTFKFIFDNPGQHAAYSAITAANPEERFNRILNYYSGMTIRMSKANSSQR